MPAIARMRRTVHGMWWWTDHKGYIKCRSSEEPKGAPSDQWERWVEWVKDHKLVTNEGEIINMRTLTIELRFDADEEGKHEVLIEAAKQAAKHLFTNALLMSTKRKPQIAMYSSDMFTGKEEILLAADLEG